MTKGKECKTCTMKLYSLLQLPKVLSRAKSTLQHYRKHTLTADEVAPVFREPFIQTGYRLPDQSWGYYWRSLFWIHNETANIWSHLAATLIIIKNIWELSQSYDFIHDKYGWSLVGFSLGCLLGTSISTIAHQLHSKSIWWHYVLFMIDYGGVTLYTFGTGLGCIYICSQRDVYRYLEPFFLPLNAFLSWFTFYICCRAKIKFTAYTRGIRLVTMITAYFVYAMIISIPVFARYTECLSTAGCSILSLNHLTTCFLLIALSAALFVCHAPERLAPGKFDIVGHGHSLFHLVSMVAMSMQMKGVRVDIRRGAAAHANPSLGNILLTYGVLISAQVLTIVYLRHDIARKVMGDTDHWQSIHKKKN